jgi:hypothetical protein
MVEESRSPLDVESIVKPPQDEKVTNEGFMPEEEWQKELEVVESSN